MKLKKNNMYLMHLVQPATAMLPVWISSVPSPPQISSLSWVTRSVPEQLGFIRARWGVKILRGANSSFLIKNSENRDGELPTEQNGQEEKECGSRVLQRLRSQVDKKDERDRRLGFKS